MSSKKILFKNKGESYELAFEVIGGDELYPCVLFYYMNDEVEFISSYK